MLAPFVIAIKSFLYILVCGNLFIMPYIAHKTMIPTPMLNGIDDRVKKDAAIEYSKTITLTPTNVDIAKNKGL